MERDFYECWNMANHTDTLKDCSSCSWRGQNVTKEHLPVRLWMSRAAGKGGLPTVDLNSFICGDCMDYLPQFPDNFFDLAIVDPPYFSGPERREYYGRKISPIGVQRHYEPSENWEVPGLEYFRELQIYIAAGEEKLKELQETTLPQLHAEAAAKGDAMSAQVVRDSRTR